ncbi:MAG: Hsp20/alpha crystallin family protein [Myxococcales bacterium]|nr:Hsp20/alpha crystallin family protein [Myxococcales bacterium]
MNRPRPVLAGLLDLRARMNQLFDELVQAREAGGAVHWTPVADVIETSSGYALSLELSGVDPAEVDIVVDGRTVVVSGHRPYPVDTAEGAHRIERNHGAFTRAFELPAPVVASSLSRRYERGVLTLCLHRE